MRWIGRVSANVREVVGGFLVLALVTRPPLGGLRPWKHLGIAVLRSRWAMVLCRLGVGESGFVQASIGERGSLWGLPIVADGRWPSVAAFNGCHLSCVAMRDNGAVW